ncbi:carbohydrate kinase family protein [Caldivirga maquilingensis]|uniref:PfkB domain protein n=1 Tax=Caldivirga maquilingensis (strain ATCC 700844 / DSM 13496 / JCM 10307 / IC-167) TaxID=397948 RepID=A8MB85_CALMQ|nr:carbohydrate kinase family protein [Caldivirga maquilingensis]ABW01175.1 PfkB domain protein [Caldivirga maquilingensis IC-167]
MLDLLVVSDCVLDIYYRVKRLPIKAYDIVVTNEPVLSPGGACSVAVVASKLGLRVAVVDKLGDDPFSVILINMLEKANVYTGFIKRMNGSYTTVSNNIIDELGRYAFLGYLGAGAHLTPSDIDEQVVKSFKAVFISGFNIAYSSDVKEAVIKVIKTSVNNGVMVFLDPGPAAGFVKELVTLIKPPGAVLLNSDEAKALYGLSLKDTIKVMRRSGGSFIIKLGSKGALLVNNNVKHCPTRVVKRVLTTIGAGDAFDAAYITGLLRGLSGYEACRLANHVASLRLNVLSTMDMPDMRGLIEQWIKGSSAD